MEQNQRKLNLSKPEISHLSKLIRNYAVVSLISLTTLLSSCGNEESRKDYFQDSVGQLAELIVVYDKAHSTEQFKETVNDVFGAKINGLPPPSEPRFKVIFGDQTYFEGYFQEHHNIFVCLTEDNLDELTAIYGPENKEKVKEIIANNKALGYNKTDVWAKNQNVFYITAKNHDSLLVKLKRRSGELLSQANRNEVNTGAHKVLTIPTSRDSVYLDWMGRKGFALRKPNSYRVAIDQEEFLWLRKNTDKHDYGLLLHFEPYTSEDQFTLEEVIARRNEITKKYIPGEVEGSYMVVDPRLEPHFEEINFNGKYAVLMKGWWRVHNDFMAGPFVSYSIYDKNSGLIVTAEGYVYGPNESKAKALREIEVILQSLVIK